MMWGVYLWPRYDWTLRDRREDVVRRLRDLGEPAWRVRDWMAWRLDLVRSDVRWASRCLWRK